MSILKTHSKNEKYTRAQKIGLSIGFVLVFLWMLVIFSLSAQVATESSALSNSVLQKLLSILPFTISSFFLRKLAHFTEFMILCILLFHALYWVRLQPRPILAFLLTVLYAVSDEIHQIFVPGRACQFRDMCIDAGGALLGVLLALAVYSIFKKHSLKKEREIYGDHSTV